MCFQGIGHLLARHLNSMGATVFAGCLHADGPGATELKNIGSDRMHVLQMDVTSEEQVTKSAQYINETLKGSGRSLGHWHFLLGICQKNVE
jgi:3-hydroxybutyrate dehydrogenase